MEVTEPRELEKLVSSTGFTPGRADLGALFDLLATAPEELAKDVVRALGRRPDVAVTLGARRLGTDPVEARPWIARLLGALGGAEAIDALLAALEDPDERTRRAAARALGNMQDARIEPALVARLDRGPSPAEARVLSAALGKVGGEAARERLGALAEDPELAKAAGRAALLADRRRSRDEGEAASIDLDASPELPLTLVFRCRAGLAQLLAEEIASLALGGASKAMGDDAVVVEGVTAPLARALGSRIALDVAVRLPPVDGASAASIAAALTSPVAKAVFGRHTRGAATFRLDWVEGGHKRALAWDVAAAVARAGGARNDPRSATWVARVSLARGAAEVGLVPVGPLAARFAYRVRDVPAASHPTIAAAIARLGGVDADDVVWDPFVGSGTEIVERARLGPYRALFGSDLDRRALAAADENLRAARVDGVRLVQGDALVVPPPRGLSLVLTNPPLGRRVRRDAELKETLARFVARVGAALAPGGRLVWIAPHAHVARREASGVGLELVRSWTVDLGGFSCEIQRFERR